MSAYTRAWLIESFVRTALEKRWAICRWVSSQAFEPLALSGRLGHVDQGRRKADEKPKDCCAFGPNSEQSWLVLQNPFNASFVCRRYVEADIDD